MHSVLLFSILSLCSGICASEDCASLYRDHLLSDMQLSYQEFDQSDGKGFRALAEKGCDREAANLIKEYLRINQSSQSSLRWHIAQLKATAGESAEAIEFAKGVLAESEDFAKNPFRWNDYVLATIAFLEHNKQALLYHRNKVAQSKTEYFGNELNLRLLDSLIKYFDRDYKYATSHIGM